MKIFKMSYVSMGFVFKNVYLPPKTSHLFRGIKFGLQKNLYFVLLCNSTNGYIYDSSERPLLTDE